MGRAFSGVTLMQQPCAILLPQCADRGAKVKTRMGGEGGVLQQGRERWPGGFRVHARPERRSAYRKCIRSVPSALRANDTRDAAAERERGVREIHATRSPSRPAGS